MPDLETSLKIIVNSINENTLTLIKDSINSIKEYNTYYDININNLNKIDTKIEMLKQEVLTSLESVINSFEIVVKALDKLPVTANILEIYTNLIDVTNEIFFSEMCLSGVYFQEEFYYPQRRYYVHLKKKHPERYTNTVFETPQEFKRRMIKQLNKAKRMLKKVSKELSKIPVTLEKLDLKPVTVEDPIILGGNCNDWLEGIAEVKYSYMSNGAEAVNVGSIGTVEEKKRIIEEIIKRV